MNVLVIAPHPDDESIGCGGTICLHTGRGDRVAVAFLTSGEAGLTDVAPEEAQRIRERESSEAAAILAVSSLTFLRCPDGHLDQSVDQAAAALRPVVEEERPDLIYLAHDGDWHPDHRACGRIVRRVLRSRSVPPPRLLCYEILTPLGEFDCVLDITSVLDRKINAVRAHRSQVRQLRYDVGAAALNRYRGITAGTGRYAEVFRQANGSTSRVPRVHRANPGWHRVFDVSQEIGKLVRARDSFILVDDGRMVPFLQGGRARCIPFLEKNGCYWGKPADDTTAVNEVERLRRTGAGFIVFVPGTFWWLDFYVGLNRYLTGSFQCVRRDQNLVAFDLRQPINPMGRHQFLSTGC